MLFLSQTKSEDIAIVLFVCVQGLQDNSKSCEWILTKLSK